MCTAKQCSIHLTVLRQCCPEKLALKLSDGAHQHCDIACSSIDQTRQSDEEGGGDTWLRETVLTECDVHDGIHCHPAEVLRVLYQHLESLPKLIGSKTIFFSDRTG